MASEASEIEGSRQQPEYAGRTMTTILELLLRFQEEKDPIECFVAECHNREAMMQTAKGWLPLVIQA